MIDLKNITIRNFMSVGNVSQAISFSDGDLTLVIGDNLDLGGNGSRNGVGKTTFINALCFAFFGTAITNIKKDNLVNRTNNKDMMVSVEFKKNDVKYRIERGRKPAIFKFMVNDVDIDAETDEGQGENKFTQLEVEKVLGMGHTMFKHLVTLNTFTEPFLSLGANAQREIIEQLLGITLLSEKASVLRELVKTTKDSIKEEEIKLKTIEDANQRIEKSIKDLVLRQRVWATKKSDDIIAYHHALGELEIVNIDQELAAHEARVTWKQHDKSSNHWKEIIPPYRDPMMRMTNDWESIKENCLRCKSMNVMHVDSKYMMPIMKHLLSQKLHQFKN